LTVSSQEERESALSPYQWTLLECPSGFLPQGLRYYVCPSGVSFDNPGENVMSHGGMSIDEVVVLFITVRAGACNG
jgi:hypothetical protein